jgi:hypothetical protein
MPQEKQTNEGGAEGGPVGRNVTPHPLYDYSVASCAGTQGNPTA